MSAIYGPFGQAAQIQQPGVMQQQQQYPVNGGGVVYQQPPVVTYPMNNGGGGINTMPNAGMIQQPQTMQVGNYPAIPVFGGQTPVSQVSNWEQMVCEILNYEVNNHYQPRNVRIQAISEIAAKFGIGIQGCGQNRLVLNFGKILNGVSEYVLKIASCNLGVIDNMGEYMLSVMLNTKAAGILALTEFDLGPLARYFKPINNPEFHGRFIIQKKINGLSEIAKSMIDTGRGNGKTMAQIAQGLLDERESERKNIVTSLAVSSFIFDVLQPFQYGIDPADNKLKLLDYGYIVPYSVFDLCCGVPKGTYTFVKNVNIGGLMQQKEGLKCTSSSCTGSGNGMMHYVEVDGAEVYRCDTCGHQVSASDIKARLIKSWA